ncbi:hypothetical protein EV421DRAFT_1888044 [Armillaria borealis]|uniref:CxC2-like cysteine cluster KDZ transposase-associated domain-containing protein n=1 Tax=Armillaria borealis TaxID=47425 RepID=A0AA39K3R7_9AGAR|nr:hypothetical protein EV421DRAFT_1888044 [Armillaria borealis]
MGVEICDSCDTEQPAVFRCCSCFSGRSLCSECMINDHQDAPFHRIEEWNGTFYTCTTLQDIGLKVQLGHPLGEKCPYPRVSGRQVVVIDVEGIHKVNVWFCGCHQTMPLYVQMLHARWFPATVELPRTAVTFAALHHFQMMTFMSKVSGYEYYHLLARLSDNTGVTILPVCP